MSKAAASMGRRSAGGRAIRVVIPEDLEAKVEAEARRRGLTLGTVVRMLLLERVEELDDLERLTRAEEWQRAEAWATWQRMKDGDVCEVSKSEIDAEFDHALLAARRVTP
jgi:hypothetical protein